MLIFRSPIIPSIGPSFCFIEGRSNGNLICIQQVLLSRLLEHVIREYGISFKANVLRNFVHSQFFFHPDLRFACSSSQQTQSVSNLFLLLLETNLTQFTTFYNERSRRRQRDTFFLRTHICFLPPPASHFTSKAGLALRFKPRAKMCSNMSTKRRRKLIKGRMRLSTYLENGVSVCREHHNVCSLQRKIAQENEKNPPSVLKSYLRFDFLFSFEFLVISILL